MIRALESNGGLAVGDENRVDQIDGSLAVNDSGDGPVLVLVHGFPLDHTMWTAQIENLRDAYRVVAPDLRGFGASETEDAPESMARHADDVAALLDGLGIEEPVVYCGLSMGGYVGWEFVRRHRERLRGLIVCDSRAAADTDEGRANRGRMARSVRENGPTPAVEAMIPKLFAASTRSSRPEVVEATRATMMTTDRGSIIAALKGMAERADATDLLADLDLPVLCLCGEHDEITPAAEMETMAAAIPDGRFVAVENAGHMAPLECPEPVNAAIRGFLAELATD